MLLNVTQTFKEYRYHLPIADNHRNFHRQLKECKKSNKQSHHIFELTLICDRNEMISLKYKNYVNGRVFLNERVQYPCSL